MGFEKKRKITCDNLSLQSCGDTAVVFLYLSLSASRLRIWEGGRNNGGGGGVAVERGRGVWRKRWSMWLRIMSKKLHKAFSQITYQLYAWHYPWSISSVLDQVPIVVQHKYTCTLPPTCIHNNSPLAANTQANISLSLSLFFLPIPMGLHCLGKWK